MSGEAHFEQFIRDGFVRIAELITTATA